MDPALEAALRAGAKIVHLVTVALPATTIRWSDAGFVRWGEHLWAARDATYGALDSIGEITDGIEEDPEPVGLTIIPPNLTCLADLAGASAQGGRVSIHLGCVDRVTGLLIGAPYRLHVGVLDRPVLKPGRERVLEYDILPADAWGLIVSEEQRQTHAFRQLVWPGERGDEYATDGTKQSYWREDDPKNSIGALLGRGLMKERDEENKAIEFSYEPEAPLAFPIGRCAVKGTVRYRRGFGPTNRFYSVVATVGASGPVQALVRVEIDDEVISFSALDRSINGEHTGEQWFRYLPGAQPSPALTSPTGANGPDEPLPGWTTEHTLSGRPAYIWTGRENSKKSEFRGGLPSILVIQNGLFGWDPRTGDPLNDVAAWPGLSDGGIAALNWEIGRWEGASGGGAYGVPYACSIVGGIGAPLDCIDVDAFVAVAEIADLRGWKVAGVLFSDRDKTDELEDLLAAAGAKRARKCGMVSCVSFGAPAESRMTVTKRDTVGSSIETVLFPSLLDRRNTGIGRFLSEANRWEITPIDAVSNPAWIEADQGRQTMTVDLIYQPNADSAAQLTYLAVAYEREGTGEAPVGPWMLALEPGDAFDWDEPEFLLTGIKARVERRRYTPGKGVVRMRYRTETDSKFGEAFGVTGTAPPPTDPEAPPPPYVEPPSDFMTDTDGYNVTVSYRNPVSAYYDFVQMYRATDSTSFTDATAIGFYAGSPGEFVNFADDALPPGHAYCYWPIVVDASGNMSSHDLPGLPLIVSL